MRESDCSRSHIHPSCRRLLSQIVSRRAKGQLAREVEGRDRLFRLLVAVLRNRSASYFFSTRKREEGWIITDKMQIFPLELQSRQTTWTARRDAGAKSTWNGSDLELPIALADHHGARPRPPPVTTALPRPQTKISSYAPTPFATRRKRNEEFA